MTKAPAPTENPKSNGTGQKRHQNFDHTAIADGLRTVSWSNINHPTIVIKPVYERSSFQLTTTAG